MKSIAEAFGSAAIKAVGMAEYTRERHAELIQAGHEKWGWPLDAQCANCGDSGKWPNSMHYCGCPAGEARKIREREASEREEWLRRWSITGVPRRFRSYRLEGSQDQTAVACVREWLAREPSQTGENLILTGPVGTGKTGLAVGALWELHCSGFGSLSFTGVPALLDGLRPDSEEPGLMRSCQRVGVLTLDDLGVEKPSDWVRERLFILLNSRYEDQLPTIVTTNVGLKDLASVVGERTVSRLAEAAVVVPVDGEDLRRS